MTRHSISLLFKLLGCALSCCFSSELLCNLPPSSFSFQSVSGFTSVEFYCRKSPEVCATAHPALGAHGRGKTCPLPTSNFGISNGEVGVGAPRTELKCQIHGAACKSFHKMAPNISRPHKCNG